MASEGVTAGRINVNQATFRAIVIMSSIAFYNVIELMFLIFVTFKRYSGLYFYSIVASSLGCFLHGMGFLMKFFQLTQYDYFSVTIITIGWYTMVTGQSLVLFARLHLVEMNENLRKRILYIIIIDAIILHIPTTVLTYGSNNRNEDIAGLFAPGYAVMEKIQMTIFTLQELMISVVYIRAATRFMQNTTSGTRKKLLAYLLAVNVIIIVFDLVLLGTEYANLYTIQVILKSLVYSIKLKLEFSVLGKLIALARPNGGFHTETTISPVSRTTRAQSDGAIFSPTSPEPFELHKMESFSNRRGRTSGEIWERPRSYIRERQF